MGDNFRPKVDNTYNSGTPTNRWGHIYTVLATVDTMDLATGSITDSTGAIDFDDENLSTTGTVTVDTMLLDTGSITDTTGAIDFDNENLSTTGMWDIGNVRVNTNTLSITNLNGDMNLAANGTGVVNVLSDMVALSLTITGTLDVTGLLDVDNIRLDGNTISITDVNGNMNLVANGTGVIDLQSAMTTVNQTVTGIMDITGQLDVDDIRINTGSISNVATNGTLDLMTNGTGTVRVTGTVRPVSDGGYSLGTVATRWNNVYLSGGISDGTDTTPIATAISLRAINTGVSPGDSIFWDGSKWVASAPDTEIDHGSISGLGDDDHTQYALLAGRAGGQLLIGGTVASNNLTLESTSNPTKGSIIFRDTLRPDVDDTSDVGTASFRVKDLYMSGEGVGFRFENAATFAGLPAPSVSSKGRVAWVDDTNTVYVDDGGVWVAAAAAVAGAGIWTKYTFVYTDFAAASTFFQIELRLLAANEVIEGFIIKHTTPFAGGGATGANLRVGTAADNNRFVGVFDVFQAAGDTVFDVTNILEYVSGAPESIKLGLGSNVNTNTLTQGAATVWVKIGTLPV